MHSNSLSSPPSSSNFKLGAVPKKPTLKDNYQAFLAFGAKLQMLANEVADNPQEQADFDRQQENCLVGQATLLNVASHHDIKSMECAQLLMSLWSEETRQNQDPSDMTEIDRIVLKVFEYFQKTAFFHG